jgi:hypothetical protein
MKRMIVNIGTPKTGSTSIQQTLVKANSLGQLGAVCYLEDDPSLRVFKRGFFAALYRNDDKLPRMVAMWLREHGHALEAQRELYRTNLAEVIEREDSMLVCNEYLASVKPDQITRFSNEMKEYGVQDIRVVLYVRDPVSFYLSSLQQNLVGSHVPRNPVRYRYTFRSNIRNWKKVFGDALMVRAFDTQFLLGECVVRDFLSIAEDYLNATLKDIEVIRSNESLSREAISILQRFRADLFADKDGMALPVISLLRSTLMKNRHAFEHKAKLRPWVASAVLERHRDDLEWLRREHGIDFLSRWEGLEPLKAPEPGKSEWTLKELLDSESPESEELRLMHLINELLSGKMRLGSL